MNEPTRLENLPAEVFLNILEFTHPSSHLPLSLTCKAINSLVSDVVESHRTATAEYETITCLSPSALPRLLDIALGAELKQTIEAWSIKRLEVSRSHMTMASLGIYLLDGRLPHLFTLGVTSPEVYEEHYINEAFRRRLISQQRFDAAGYMSLATFDALHRVIFFSALPNLTELKIISSDMIVFETLRQLCQSIAWGLVIGACAPGLSSLQRVAICGNRQDIKVDQLARILQLPNLSELSLSRLRILGYGVYDRYFYTENENSDEESLDTGSPNLGEDSFRHRMGLPTKSSSVKHLDFTDVTLSTKVSRDLFCKTPKNLESIVMRLPEGDHVQEPTEFLKVLARYQDTSLRKLLIYGEGIPRETRGNVVTYKPSNLKAFNNLQVMNVHLYDLISDACTMDKESEYIINSEVLVNYFLETFPETMSVIVIHCTLPRGLNTDVDEGIAGRLDDFVEALVKCDRYKDLQAMYLRDIESWAAVPNDYVCFPKTMAAGREHGVYIDTMASPQWSDDRNAYFPSMQWARPIDSPPSVFNPYNGRWEAR